MECFAVYSQTQNWSQNHTKPSKIILLQLKSEIAPTAIHTAQFHIAMIISKKILTIRCYWEDHFMKMLSLSGFENGRKISVRPIIKYSSFLLSLRRTCKTSYFHDSTWIMESTRFAITKISDKVERARTSCRDRIQRESERGRALLFGLFIADSTYELQRNMSEKDYIWL